MLVNRVCTIPESVATSSRTPSRRSPRCSGGSVAVVSVGGAKRVEAVSIPGGTPPSPRIRG